MDRPLPFLPEVLRTGIPEIDLQHNALFQQVNEIESACIDSNRLRREDADSLLASLRQHFATEASLAGQAGVDFAEHETRHGEMYRMVALALEQGGNKLENLFGLVRYLQYWFERHIVHDDLPLGRRVLAMSASDHRG